MATVHTSANRTHEPNWVGLARTYGAMSTYRATNHPASADCYVENYLHRTYEETILRDAPLIYYKLNIQLGDKWVDSSPNGIHSEDDSAATTASTTGPIFGSTDTAPSFGVTTGPTDTPHRAWTSDPIIDVDFPFSMEIWAKQTDDRGSGNIMTMLGDSDFRVNFQISGDGRLELFDDSTSLVQTIVGGTCITTDPGVTWYNARHHDIGADNAYFNDGEWHHVVVTYTETKAYMYVDGQLYIHGSDTDTSGGVTHSMTSPADSSGAVTLKIGWDGASPGAAQWLGYLSNFSLYDYQLSTTQVNEHFIAGAKPDSYKLGTANNTSGYPITGELTIGKLGDHRNGPRVLWGDKFAQTTVMTPTAFNATEAMTQIGDAFGRPERQMIKESKGSFTLIVGVVPTIDATSETKAHTIFDNRILGAISTCNGGSVIDEFNTVSGFAVFIDEDGYPMVRWKGGTTDELIDTTTAFADGEFAFLSCVMIANQASTDDTTVSLMKDHNVVVTATGQDDTETSVQRVKFPSIGVPTGGATDSSPASENWQGKIGPILMFWNADMTTDKVTQIIRAIKQSDWPTWRRHSTRRVRRPQHLYAPSRP